VVPINPDGTDTFDSILAVSTDITDIAESDDKTPS
jgi:hypothetical protein